MRKTVRRPRYHPPLAFIILPMIDIIFLLLLFFAMVTSFEAAAKIRVDIPKPEASQARKDTSARQVVVNCELADGATPDATGVVYRIAADPPEPLSAIAARLVAAQASDPQLAIVIRADRRLPYEKVRAVMQAAADSGITILNVSAMRDAGGT